MGRDVKSNEGQQSAYGEQSSLFMTVHCVDAGLLAKQGQGLGNTDRGMTSADVSSVVTSGNPPKEDRQRETVSKAK